MSDLERAIGIIHGAEVQLKELMERALSEQRYRDLAVVAPLAEAVGALGRAHSQKEIPSPASAMPEVPGVALAPAAESHVAASSVAAKSKARAYDYPQFKRDGEKLVKVGWSKKDRREYEHRAPRAAVFAVAKILCSSKKPREVFSMDEMLPFKGDGSEEIPSYQAYLALAWFRNIGAVEQRGKDGYAIIDDQLQVSNVTKAWANLAPMN
jgi:hypothetical protein